MLEEVLPMCLGASSPCVYGVSQSSEANERMCTVSPRVLPTAPLKQALSASGKCLRVTPVRVNEAVFIRKPPLEVVAFDLRGD